MVNVHTPFRSLLFAFLLMGFGLHMSAQEVRKVESDYTYYPPENVSLEEARRIALERAQIQAIAKEFSTIVTQTNSTITKNGPDGSSVDFVSIGGSDLKGEWLETIGEPQYEVNYQDGMLVIRVHVKGRIREIKSAPIDFSAKVLTHTDDTRHEQTNLLSGDDLYLSFSAPIDGYLAVYLLNMEDTAFCLLPYQSDGSGRFPIRAGQSYMLFSAAAAPIAERALVDEYTITASHSVERNQLYIIFSPRPFTKALDHIGTTDSEALPRQVTRKDFERWLSNIRKHDPDMRVEKKLLTITAH